MQAAKKYLIFILVIAVVAIEVHGQFMQNGLKKFYVERTLRLNWYGAWNYCRANNMTLISIETAEEQQQLEQMLRTHFNFWTSGNENAYPSSTTGNRRFRWAANGRDVTYTNWYVTEPNNVRGGEHCINIYGRDFLWNDESCSSLYPFICQY